MTQAYYSITGTPKVLSVDITTSHSSPTASATFTATSTSLDIGDAVNIYLGYVGDYDLVFSGYVKQIEKNVPETKYTITASDDMVKAVDFFVASEDPNAPATYGNITAEALVQNIMGMAGLTNYTYDPTYFTFGTTHDFTVNQVPAYDYCRAIADIITWHLWCDITGKVHFENRKPYIMTGDTGQPGDTVDERPLVRAVHTITVVDSLNASWQKNEKNLRNKVVVYGADDSHATASASSPYLPSGFYKTVVANLQTILPSNLCQTTANYNLNLLNRLTYSMRIAIVGNPHITAREIVRVTNSFLSVDSNWYAYTVQHQYSDGGYTTSLELRQ
jgi:hypothetical protein